MCVLYFLGRHSRETKIHQILVMWLSFWLINLEVRPTSEQVGVRFLDNFFTLMVPNW